MITFLIVVCRIQLFDIQPLANQVSIWITDCRLVCANVIATFHTSNFLTYRDLFQAKLRWTQMRHSEWNNITSILRIVNAILRITTVFTSQHCNFWSQHCTRYKHEITKLILSGNLIILPSILTTKRNFWFSISY